MGSHFAATDARCASFDAASELGAGDAADPRATAVMASIERDFRRGARIVRMDIRTHFLKRSKLGPRFDREPNQKTLWGVFSGHHDRTDLLYVFSGPGRLAGTTLLMP